MPPKGARQKTGGRAPPKFVAPTVMDKHFGYTSVKKHLPGQQTWPKWHDDDWRVVPHPYKWKDEGEKEEKHDLWISLGLPEDVTVAYNFTAKMECLAELTAYTEHKSPAALETMVDTVGKFYSSCTRLGNSYPSGCILVR